MVTIEDSTATPEQALQGYRIADELRQAILAGAKPPGSRIRQEELAAHFGTSRIPVREALRQLESEGLVLLIPNSGAWVAKLNLRECTETYQIRERLEPLAIAESIPRMNEATIERIAQLAKEIDETDSVETALRLDREFHLLTYKAADMPSLYVIAERFWNTTQQYRRAYAATIGREAAWISNYEHKLLVEAIQRRDAEGAERILFGHIRRTRLELQKHPEIFDEALPRKRRRRRSIVANRA